MAPAARAGPGSSQGSPTQDGRDLLPSQVQKQSRQDSNQMLQATGRGCFRQQHSPLHPGMLAQDEHRDSAVTTSMSDPSGLLRAKASSLSLASSQMVKLPPLGKLADSEAGRDSVLTGSE